MFMTPLLTVASCFVFLGDHAWSVTCLICKKGMHVLEPTALCQFMDVLVVAGGGRWCFDPNHPTHKLLVFSNSCRHLLLWCCVLSL